MNWRVLLHCNFSSITEVDRVEFGILLEEIEVDPDETKHRQNTEYGFGFNIYIFSPFKTHL